MQQRNGLPVLGFGCMRFATKGRSIDMEKTEAQLLRAIELGVNYFDTAYIYPGSEDALGKIIEKNDLRSKITLTTKLPQYLVKKRADLDKYLDEELKRLRTDHLDYYLFHHMTDIAQWEKLEALGVRDWIAEQKKSGRVLHFGFSFHGNTEMYKKILAAFDWELSLVQYNYMDETSQAGREGIAAAYEKGVPVFIMEPLRGGKLVDLLPEKAKKEIAKDSHGWSPAEWAFRWLWNQKEITCVLSGMNSLEMLEENARIASDAKAGAWRQEEFAMIEKIKGYINENTKVGCTGCKYCLPCPRGVDIPNARKLEFFHFQQAVRMPAAHAAVADDDRSDRFHIKNTSVLCFTDKRGGFAARKAHRKAAVLQPPSPYRRARRQPHGYVAAGHRGNGKGRKSAVLERCVHRKTAPRSESRKAAGIAGGYGGQQRDLVLFALQQHLGDPGRAAEVPVDLERRVGVEEVRQRGFRKERPEVLCSLLSVPETGVQANEPRAGPARVTAAVGEPFFEGLRYGVEERRGIPADRVVRVKREGVRDMPVAGFGLLIGLQPFVEPSVRPDGQGGQPPERIGRLPPHGFVRFQQLGGGDEVPEHRAHDLDIHRGGEADVRFLFSLWRRQIVAVLGRGGGPCMQPAVRTLKEIIEVKARGGLHKAVGGILQKG